MSRIAQTKVVGERITQLKESRLYLDFAIDIHSSIESEQDVHDVIANRVIDVVAFLEDEASDVSTFVVNMAKARIAAGLIQHELVNRPLELIRLLFRVLAVVLVNRPQAFARAVGDDYFHALAWLRALKRAMRTSAVSLDRVSKRPAPISSSP